MTKPLHFLLCNDDGFRAPGIQELARRMMSLGEVTIVAPEGPRSGFSGAITTTLPLRLKPRHEEEGLRVFSVDGTPSDCVKLALEVLYPEQKPDLVLSGINHGSNDGICVHYSGTLGAAREACINGVAAIALSLDDTAERPDFGDALELSEQVVRHCLSQGIPQGVLYSVNIPKTKPLGLKVCRQAVSRFVGEWCPSHNAKGQDVYWLTGRQALPREGKGDSDIELLRAGYATISPLMLDQTDYSRLESLAQEFEDSRN